MHRIYSSSRNTRVFRHEIRAQSETCLHREYNLAMKNKSLRRIADVRSPLIKAGDSYQSLKIKRAGK